MSIFDQIVRIHAHSSFVRRSPNQQVDRAGKDFVVRVRPNHFEGEVIVHIE